MEDIYDEFDKFKTFEDYLRYYVELYKSKDLHVNNGDSLIEKGVKDGYFGKLVASEDILKAWYYFKGKCVDCEYYRIPDSGCDDCEYKKLKGGLLSENDRETYL